MTVPVLAFAFCALPFDLSFPLRLEKPVRAGQGKAADLKNRSALPFLHRLAIKRIDQIKHCLGGATAFKEADDGMAGVALQFDVAIIAGAHDGGIEAG